MSAIFEIMLEVYGFVLIGFVFARLGWFSRNATDGLIEFVFNISIPALLIRSLTLMEIPDFLPVHLLVTYYLSVFLVLMIATFISKIVFSLSVDKCIIFAYSGTFSNTVLLGIPVILKVLGEKSLLPLMLIISLHGLTLLGSMTVFLEANRANGGSLFENIRSAVWRMIKNPILIGIAFGLIANFFGIVYPPVIDHSLLILGEAAIPVSLFSFGAKMNEMQITGDLLLSFVAALLKNVVLPLSVWLTGNYVCHPPGNWLIAATMLAAMPTGINIFLFAHRYQQAAALSTTTIVVSTLLSLFSVPMWIYSLTIA
jgi:hypothetical protein